MVFKKENTMQSSQLRTFFAGLIKPKVQIACVFFIVATFATLLYISVKAFDATDPKPALIQSSDTAGAPVKVGLIVTNFPKFSIIDNTFTADLILWFEFDSDKIPLDTIKKFSFERGKIDDLSEPHISKNGTNTFVRYRVRITFTSPLDHALFPLNDHTLYITLKNEYITPDKLRFVAPRSSFVIEPEAETDVWTVVGRSTETGYFEDILDETASKTLKHPGVVFSIDLAKQGIRKVFIIMLPMLILFIIASFTFLLDPKKLASSILGLSTGTLTGLIAYRFVIERVIPNVGYFTLTDHVFNLFLVAIFVIFIVNILAIKQGEDTESVKALKGASLLAIQVVLLVSFFILMI